MYILIRLRLSILGGESGIENSSASVSGGGVLMGNNGDVLRSSMNNG